MGNKAEQQVDSLAIALKRAKILCTLQTQQGEPHDIVNNMRYDMLVMRAELSALRDMMMKRGNFNQDEHKKRFMNILEDYSKMLSESMGVLVTDNGLIVESSKIQ